MVASASSSSHQRGRGQAPGPSASSSSKGSLALLPLLVGLMLMMLSPTQAAPANTTSAAAQHAFVASTVKGHSRSAALRAAQLSMPASASAQVNKVSNSTNDAALDLSPYKEVHLNPLPKSTAKVYNGTVVAGGRLYHNVTLSHNGTILTNGTENGRVLTTAPVRNTTEAVVADAQSKLLTDTSTSALELKKKKHHHHHHKTTQRSTTHKKKHKKHHKKTTKKHKKKKTKKTSTSSSSNSGNTNTNSNTATFPTTVTNAASGETTDDCSDTTADAALPGSQSTTASYGSSGSCFPALGFTMPSDVPSSLDGWWCSPTDEYAFMGFSYEISACQSQSQLTAEFKDARNRFNARYVRLYGACDNDNYYDTVVEAAWEAGIGVHALIWFGFDGTNQWIQRRDSLFTQLHNNPKAKFVTRGVQFGSEPLFDWVMSGTDLAKEVVKAKANLADLHINLTVSDMAWSYQYQASTGSQDVLDAIDFVDAGMLPYFAQDATTGGQAWHDNANDMSFFLSHTTNKKIYWSENGWPSTHDCSQGVCPNSAAAVSSVASEQAYYDLLDSKCTTMKSYPQGGVGWFAHIYSDDQEPGYGILDTNGNLKFPFQPRTSC